MSATPTANSDAPTKPEIKPRRPRPDALTYDQAEVAYVLGISIRTLRRIRYRLPAPLKLCRQPRWSRESIKLWVESGARVPR
jgi:hypothetical protein